MIDCRSASSLEATKFNLFSADPTFNGITQQLTQGFHDKRPRPVARDQQAGGYVTQLTPLLLRFSRGLPLLTPPQSLLSAPPLKPWLWVVPADLSIPVYQLAITRSVRLRSVLAGGRNHPDQARPSRGPGPRLLDPVWAGPSVLQPHHSHFHFNT